MHQPSVEGHRLVGYLRTKAEAAGALPEEFLNRDQLFVGASEATRELLAQSVCSALRSQQVAVELVGIRQLTGRDAQSELVKGLDRLCQACLQVSPFDGFSAESSNRVDHDLRLLIQEAVTRLSGQPGARSAALVVTIPDIFEDIPGGDELEFLRAWVIYSSPSSLVWLFFAPQRVIGLKRDGISPFVNIFSPVSLGDAQDILAGSG